MSTFDLVGLEPEVRRRLDLLRELLGHDEPEVATKGRSGDTATRGRRERDRHGRVVRKPFSPEGHEAEPEAPVRDHMGYRLNKPYGTGRARRSA